MAAEPQKEYPQEIVRGTFFEHDVPISDIFVAFRHEPDGYARPLRPNRVNKLIKDFYRPALGVLLLSLRPDGKFACIDGQHRLDVCKHFDIKTVDAFVYIDLTIEEEAKLYRKFGDYLKQTALDRFHAGMVEKVPEYLAINAIVKQNHLFVPNSGHGGNNSINAVEALIKVATLYGPETLDKTLAFLYEVWQGEQRAYRSSLLVGTAAFLARFQDKINYKRSRLIDRVTRMGMGAVERLASSINEAHLSSQPSAAWGQALLAIHDQRIELSRQLGDWAKIHITEQQRQDRAANLTRINKALTPEQRKARAQKAQDTTTHAQRSEKAIKAAKTRRGFTPRQVDCPYCDAIVGSACVTRNDLDLPNYHNARRTAAKLWADSKLKP